MQKNLDKEYNLHFIELIGTSCYFLSASSTSGFICVKFKSRSTETFKFNKLELFLNVIGKWNQAVRIVFIKWNSSLHLVEHHDSLFDA